MMFSSNIFRFALVLAAACNAVPSAGQWVDIGTAGNYVILTKTGIDTVPTSTIIGNIGVSPIASTAMTGFSFTAHSSGQYSTSAQLTTGKAFAATSATPIPAALSTAVSDMEAAYTTAAGFPNNDATRINYGTGVLGGVFGGVNDALTPGVYTWGSDVLIGDDIYFDGNSTDVFTIQITGNLNQLQQTTVHLINGAQASNIFWQVAGFAHVEDYAHMEGILLIKTDVLFKTSASLKGRVLSQSACNLQMATIVE
jgi:hypothetical protein